MEQIFCISLVFIMLYGLFVAGGATVRTDRVAWLPPVFTLQLVQNNGTTDTMRERERRTEVLTLRHTASVSLRLWLFLTPPPYTVGRAHLRTHVTNTRTFAFFFVVVFFFQMCILRDRKSVV